MRYIVLVTILLLLAACSGGNEITGKVLDAPSDAEPARETGDSEPAGKDNVYVPPEIKEAKEMKTYEVKGQCTEDSKGVVRHFDENGRKTVYRDECYSGFFITYECDGNQA